ncbi:MAG: hypothetical protein K6E21_00540 [Bacilli bacterium]|nr:hypothetical protein [Bacilli bacterium]
MFKTKRKIVITSLIGIIGVLIGALSASLTWFAKMNSIDDLQIGGSVLSQYFDSGTGTEEDPFVITRPKHWENLVWLHNNVSNFYQAITDENVEPGQQNDQGYYFQVGKQVNNQGEYYVYDYGNDGLLNPNNSSMNSRTLNLKGLGSLIPIGCDTKPFLGVINGHGITVSGFDVVGFEDANYNLQHDSGEAGFNDIGIFGYIGNDSAVQNVYFNDFTIHLAYADAYRSNNNQLHNEGFHATNQNGSSDICYVGYIAGHMHYSSSVNQVYINNCTIDGGTTATSGFGYFGVVENQNGETKPTPLSEITEIKTAGDANNFGGSLDFESVFERLMTIFNDRSVTTAENNTTYITSQTFIKNDVTGTTELYDQTTANVTAWGQNTNSSGADYIGNSTPVSYMYGNTDAGGVFNFASDNDTSIPDSTTGNVYQCLYGESIKYTKTVTEYTFLDQWYSCFFIKNGDNYLNHRYYATVQAETDENNAAGWNIDSAKHLYTEVLDTRYYLNRNNLLLTMSTSGSTEWEQTGQNELYTIINGVNHYLDYDGTWFLSPYKDRYLISDGSNNYLHVTNTAVGNVTTTEAATKFFLSNADGNTTIGFIHDHTKYFLNNTNENLSISTSANTTWSKENSYFYVSVQGVKYYLVYENGWLLRPEDGVRLSCNGNNYLDVSGNGTQISNRTNLDTVVWHFSSSTGDTQIYYIFGGQKYYLSYNNGLVINNSPTTWHRNGNAIYYSLGNIDFYLIYDNGWRVTDLEFYLIHDQDGNYLVANGTNNFSNTTVSSDATHFYFSDTSGEYPTGTINYVYNGTIYYLNAPVTNTVASLESSTSSTSTGWSNDGNTIYFQQGSYVYYLNYDGKWVVQREFDGYYISDGTNYLVVNNGSISNTTNFANATFFNFTNTGNNPSGYINVLGTNTYLRNNGGDFTTTTDTGNRTSWDNNGAAIYNGNYYLVCVNNTWLLLNGTTGYLFSKNNYYLNLNGTTITTTQTPTTLWSATSGQIKAVGTNYYLYHDFRTDALSGSTSQNQVAWVNSGDNTSGALYWIYSSYCQYLKFSNNSFVGGYYRTSNYSVPPASDNITFTYVNCQTYSKSFNLKNVISDLHQVTTPNINVTNYTVDKNASASHFETKNYSSSIDGKQLQVCQKTLNNDVQRSGNPTYFPLRVDKVETYEGSNTYVYPSGYAASEKNTGYIISGANIHDISTNTSSMNYQKQYGDIRIAGWAISNIEGSYSDGTFGDIYTVDDNSNGNNAIRTLNNTEKADSNYTTALGQFGETLSGAKKVFGMHFMDAAINIDHTIRANQVTIMGHTYYNYELPEDSIDFNVYQKGKISFFAGNYFANTNEKNTAFFSLHRIFRDSNNNITAIKEIEEIYWHNQKHDMVNYIYKFKGDTATYTNANGTYTGATTLDSNYSSTPIFKTSWITNPNGIDSNTNRLFYFSMPCNAGEYALGSVHGENGAYLCYLDIAANGGDSVLEYYKQPENSTTFSVDYRSAGYTSPHSIIQVGVDFVDSTTNNQPDPNKLSIAISFDNSAATTQNTEYVNGLYVIHVVNKTGYTVRLSVLLVDDNGELYDDFQYAYKVLYKNNTYSSEQVIMGTTLFDSSQTPVPYWRRMAIFDIPSTGDAEEIAYQVSG